MRPEVLLNLFLLIIVSRHRSSHIGTSSKRTSTNQQIMWFQYDMLQRHLVSNWRNPQMKYFYFRFYIYSFGAYLLWSDKFITTSRQKCQRIFLEKPQLCKGCRFVGVAPRKRSVIWREYQIQRDPLMLSVHETRSTTESFFAYDCFKPQKFTYWHK